jgi:ribokinase
MSKKILVIGSSNVDMIIKASKLPKAGETITDGNFLQTFGGKGANQAVAAARSGGNVFFVSCVGDDVYGDLMIKNYKNDSINVGYVFKEKGVSSGTALIMIGDSGENYISVAPGANYSMSKSHIDKVEKLIQESDIIILQYEIQPETLEYIMLNNLKHNKRIIFNLAPARDFNVKYLNKNYILVVNETESEFLTKKKIESDRDVEISAKLLIDMGVGTAVITLGSKGVYYLSADSSGFVPSFVVDAIDSTAAGDTFCGSLSVALLEDKKLPEALKFANAAAALCVTRLGAQSSVPLRRDIENFIKLRS